MESVKKSLPNIYVPGMQGLGDNIYQRAFIKQLLRRHDVWLETSWPELYADLDVKVVRATTRLRTQSKNILRSRAAWSPPPTNASRVPRISYINAFRTGRSIVQGMEETVGVKLDAADFDLPALPPSPVKTSKPIAFVRPVTVRREWFNAARNPEPQYLAQIVEHLRSTHHIVTVADIDGWDETLVGAPIKADSVFINGELPVMNMLALLGASDIVVGGVGFIIPASIALKRRCFVVLGGQGGHNAPRMILDSRLDCSRIGFATPRSFCQCTNMRHACDKTIPDLMEQLATYLGSSSSKSPAAPYSGIPTMASAISTPM